MILFFINIRHYRYDSVWLKFEVRTASIPREKYTAWFFNVVFGLAGHELILQVRKDYNNKE